MSEQPEISENEVMNQKFETFMTQVRETISPVMRRVNLIKKYGWLKKLASIYSSIFETNSIHEEHGSKIKVHTFNTNLT